MDRRPACGRVDGGATAAHRPLPRQIEGRFAVARDQPLPVDLLPDPHRVVGRVEEDVAQSFVVDREGLRTVIGLADSVEFESSAVLDRKEFHRTREIDGGDLTNLLDPQFDRGVTRSHGVPGDKEVGQVVSVVKIGGFEVVVRGGERRPALELVGNGRESAEDLRRMIAPRAVDGTGQDISRDIPTAVGEVVAPLIKTRRGVVGDFDKRTGGTSTRRLEPDRDGIAVFIKGGHTAVAGPQKTACGSGKTTADKASGI